jgi:hypothetical protein
MNTDFLISTRKETFMAQPHLDDSEIKSLYKLAGIASLLAMATNLLDVILGFGETDVIINGSMSAVEWFSFFQVNWFKGLYTLGILNIVYMVCMIPVYVAMLIAHRRKHLIISAMATVMFLLAFAIYVSNSPAIPMLVLSGRYAAATTDAQRVLFAAAGESILARGEDFTPGSAPGLIFSGIAAITISFVMLGGGIFGKANSWIGIVGFTCLSLFTVLATFVPSLYFVAFYVFGMIGGLLALAWFVLVALRFFKLGRTNALF